MSSHELITSPVLLQRGSKQGGVSFTMKVILGHLPKEYGGLMCRVKNKSVREIRLWG